MIEHDPTLNIDSPKQWKVLPKALARDEMEAMLRVRVPASNRKEAEAIAARDRAMLEVFYAAALRVSEIIGVKLEDLKLDLGCMLVRGKGDKERIVPLGKGAQDALTRLHEGCAPDSGEREEFATSIPGTRRQKADPAAGLADGSRGFGELRDAMPARTCCGTVAPRTWSKTAPTCARCRPSWATPIFRPRRCTRTWRWIG